jgi:hypothetical protein
MIMEFTKKGDKFYRTTPVTKDVMLHELEKHKAVKAEAEKRIREIEDLLK